MFEKVRDAGEALEDAITVLADQMMSLLGQEEETHLRVASNVSLNSLESCFLTDDSL